MMTQAAHDRLMFAMRSLAGDLKVLSSLSETMEKIISSIAFVFLFDHVRVKGVSMAKIVASNGVAGDSFGEMASMDGDYAIIGASGVDDYTGSAIIFKKSGSSWSQQTEVFASDGEIYDYFGDSVSLSGDYAIIGSLNDDIGANADQGSAYVFMRSDNSWSQQSKLTASDGETADKFGWSVALSGDYALIGAPYQDSDDDGNYDDANDDQGSCYIFLRSGVSWSQQTKLTTSDGVAGDGLGYSVAISGDYALIGARDANLYQGAAYVFMRSDVSWNEQAILTASDGATSNFFGCSVSIDDSYVIVGAVFGNAGQGGAYIFMRSGSDWSQEAILTASDGASGDYFGDCVSISGDYALIGAPYADVGGNTDQGAAYVFLRNGTEWDQQMKLIASDGAVDDYYGYATALDGDYAMVGAIGVDSSQGAAYTYCMDGQIWEDCPDADDSDGSMMIGGVSILGVSLISLLLMM